MKYRIRIRGNRFSPEFKWLGMIWLNMDDGYDHPTYEGARELIDQVREGRRVRALPDTIIDEVCD